MALSLYQPTVVENGTQVLACIDAVDLHFVMPLREYLAVHSCAVTSGRKTETIPNYHLICGESNFVKEIYAISPRDQRRYLFLLWGATAEEVQAMAQEKVKIVLLDQHAISAKTAQEIFAFFFTSPAQILDLRSNLGAKIAPINFSIIETERKPASPQNLLIEGDQRRISETIAEVFSSEKRAGEHRAKFKPGTKFKLRILAGGAAVILLPLAWYILSLSISVTGIIWAGKLLQEGKTSQAMRTAQVSQFWANQGGLVLKGVREPLNLLGLDRQVNGQEQLASFLGQVALAQIGAGRVLEMGGQLGSSLLASGTPLQETVAPVTMMEKLRTELFGVQNNLGLSYAQLKRFLDTGTFPFSLANVYRQGERGLEILTQLRQTTRYVDNILALFPLAAGFKEKQTYLVLLQNNMELRPTGGFIGSLALVTLYEGRLADLTIYDVYTVDGQLKGHVDPPGPIKEILGQEHWYLRDSNWDPDFSKSAAQAAWFFEKETGIQVKGVVGVNSAFIVDLLKATGGLQLPDYNDRITSENFFGKSLFYTQTDFFPGSTQKKDFLGSLTTALMAKLTTARGVSPAEVFQAVTSALERRDILFYFYNPQLQALVESFGWDGKLLVRRDCEGSPQAPCFGDALALVEANLGVNKANYFVQQSGVRQIVIGEDGIPTETISLVYRNSASDSSADSLVYRPYLRAVLPGDSQLLLVTLDGVKVPLRDVRAKVIPPPPYYETESEEDKQTVGIAFTVAPAKEGRLTLAYRRGAGLMFGAAGAIYEAFMQKQPGTSSHWQTLVRYPRSWTATAQTGEGGGEMTQKQKTFLANEAQLEYNTTLTRDFKLRFHFVK